MKKLYISFFTVISLLIGFSSCNGLDVDSRENLDNTEGQDPGKFLTSTYGSFTNWDYAFSYLAMTDMVSDNSDKGSSPSDPGGDKQEFDELTYSSTAGSLNSMWRRWYKTIGRATDAIETVEKAKPETADQAKLYSRYVGEAKFLRAVSYFYLVRSWGDVPLQHVDITHRATKEDVYAFIEKDLKEAMEVLPVSYDAKNLGRATKGAAHGLLSKVYLYQKKWKESYDAAKKVVDPSVYGYKLMADYSLIWRVEGENSTESLFEIQARGAAPSHGVQQYSATQGPRGGTAKLGWGFNTPSDNLLKAFNDEGDDIRRDATIIFRNTTLYDGREIGPTENAMYSMKAYSSANGGADHTDKNVRYLRLGEIYLILAESANELGLTSEAQQALNTVRHRVKLESTKATSQSDLRLAIWKERRLELAMEHDRWFDLNRTGQGKTAMAADKKNYVVGKHELFPIPDLILNETPALGQNPGWGAVAK